MTSADEYSQADVDAIITSARAQLERDQTLTIGAFDAPVLDRLLKILPKYVGAQSDAQHIVSQLRDELYDGVAIASAANIHRVCANCTRCESAVSRASMPLWNVSDPDMLMIMENPSVMSRPEVLEVVGTALPSVGFSSTRVCCTFATRCEFKFGSLQAEHFGNCVKFLHHEIHALKPKIILAFGLPTYAALTQTNPKSFKDIVGTIQWLGAFPIMPLYSLNYLLRIHPKKEDVIASLEPILKTAHDFCYGD